jgi:hypothetical protein
MIGHRYTFGRRYSPVTGKARIALCPSKKSIRRMTEKVHALGESSGRNENERGSGLENARPEGRARNREGEGSMSSRTLTDTANSLRRGGSDGTMARTCQATGETLLAPVRNRRSKVGPITGEPGKWAEGERAAEGSVLAMKPGNAGGVKGPCCIAMTSTTWEARTR